MLSPDYREYYAVGAVGNYTKYDFRIDFYNKSAKVEIEKGKPESIREINTTVILPYQPSKELAIWMMKNYLIYEETHGELPLEEVPLENLITVLEKIQKYDVDDLKIKLAEKKKEPLRKAIEKKKKARTKKKK